MCRPGRGAINRVSNLERRLFVDNLSVQFGTSGAPLFTAEDIVGMIIEVGAAVQVVAMPIATIR